MVKPDHVEQLLVGVREDPLGEERFSLLDHLLVVGLLLRAVNLFNKGLKLLASRRFYVRMKLELR